MENILYVIGWLCFFWLAAAFVVLWLPLLMRLAPAVGSLALLFMFFTIEHQGLRIALACGFIALVIAWEYLESVTEKTSDNFKSLMKHADTQRRLETDPVRSEWWAGYMRGLRRAHRGKQFCSQEEHDARLFAAESNDQMRAALGAGYRAGLSLGPHEPEPSPRPFYN